MWDWNDADGTQLLAHTTEAARAQKTALGSATATTLLRSENSPLPAVPSPLSHTNNPSTSALHISAVLGGQKAGLTWLIRLLIHQANILLFLALVTHSPNTQLSLPPSPTPHPPATTLLLRQICQRGARSSYQDSPSRTSCFLRLIASCPPPPNNKASSSPCCALLRSSSSSAIG